MNVKNRRLNRQSNYVPKFELYIRTNYQTITVHDHGRLNDNDEYRILAVQNGHNVRF